MDILRIQNHDVALLTWSDIEQAIRIVAAQIRDAAFLPTVIVGIARGGYIPAVWLCHLLGVKQLHVIEIRTTQSNEIRSQRIRVPESSTSPHDYRAERVLIVDDVTNTGATLLAARRAMIAAGCVEFRTAALFRDTVDADDTMNVDFIGPSINAWTGFPWER